MQLLSYADLKIGHILKLRREVKNRKNKMARFYSLAHQQKEIQNFIDNLSDIEVDDEDDSYSTDEGITFVFLCFDNFFSNI